jgi:polyribonucleotide nucleotidyltransferase
MIEAGAKEVGDEDMYEAIMLAHKEIKKICGFIADIVMEVGKDKFAYARGEFENSLLRWLEGLRK